MFDGIRNRWNNWGVNCLKCQKKLVADEKWVCKRCKHELGEAGAAILIFSFLFGRGIHKHNHKT